MHPGFSIMLIVCQEDRSLKELVQYFPERTSFRQPQAGCSQSPRLDILDCGKRIGVLRCWCYPRFGCEQLLCDPDCSIRQKAWRWRSYQKTMNVLHERPYRLSSQRSMTVKGHFVKKGCTRIVIAKRQQLLLSKLVFSCKSNWYQIPEDVNQLNGDSDDSFYLSSNPQNLLLKNLINKQVVTADFPKKAIIWSRLALSLL